MKTKTLNINKQELNFATYRQAYWAYFFFMLKQHHGSDTNQILILKSE